MIGSYRAIAILVTAVVAMPAEQTRFSLLGEPPGVASLTFVSPTVGFALADSGIARTDNAGESWRLIPFPHSFHKGSAYSALFSARFSIWLQGLVRRSGDESVVWRSKDGGSSWAEMQGPPAGTTLLWLSPNGDEAWAGGGRSVAKEIVPEGQINCPQRLEFTVWAPILFHKLRNSESWREEPLPRFNGCPVSHVLFLDADHGIAVAQNSVFFTSDRGARWQLGEVARPKQKVPWLEANLLPAASLVAIPGNPTSTVLSFQSGEILVSEDSGRHWTEIVEGGQLWTRRTGNGNYGAFCADRDGKIWWSLSGEGQLMESRNRGRSWAALTSEFRLQDLIAGKGLCVAVDSKGRLLRVEAPQSEQW